MFVVIEATVDDIPELNKLINSAYRGAPSKQGWTTEAEILGGIRIDEETLMEYFNREEISILKCIDKDGEILGTVYLELTSPKLYLGMFAVSPRSQGKGLGKTLMDAAEIFASANQCDRIAITVISIREELIQWYKRQGYMETGESIAFEEIEKPFGDPKIQGIRLISMEKLLSTIY